MYFILFTCIYDSPGSVKINATILLSLPYLQNDMDYNRLTLVALLEAVTTGVTQEGSAIFNNIVIDVQNIHIVSNTSGKCKLNNNDNTSRK